MKEAPPQAGASLDAVLLLAEAAGLTKEQLYTHADNEITNAQEKRYCEFLDRRLKGECTAYILGRKEFWGLEFYVTPAVLVPRPETEILVEAAVTAVSAKLRRGTPRSALDLCTGSGAVAIALKHECPDLEVMASDISEEALLVARKNSECLGCAVSFFQGDLFDTVRDSRRFCLITANAPYIPAAAIESLPAEVRNEPRIALDGGEDGLDLIRRIITEAPQYLETGGALALEADPSQMETLALLMTTRGFSQLKQYRDLAGMNRVISGIAG